MNPRSFRLQDFLSRLVLASLFLIPAVADAQNRELPPRELPPLLRTPKADKPIMLAAADIRAEISGSLATTRITLVFFNPNDRQLEGDLGFPLREGQTVTGFSLESLDGKGLLQAVPVEKAKGRQVLEEIERRGADPALLEQTGGNQFHLRVYPLLPNKPRRVELEITEVLHAGKDGRLSYRLPLNFGSTVAANLQVMVNVQGVAAKNLRLGAGLVGATVANQHGTSLVMLEKKSFRSSAAAELNWVANANDRVFSSRFEGEDYFFAEIPLKVPPLLRMPPKSVALIWDASGSGAQRDHDKEFALLNAWLRSMDEVRLSLTVVRDKADAPQEFLIRKGDWQDLRKVLESLVYDGASNAGAWVPDKDGKFDLGLLFSDGQANWGDTNTPASPSLLYTISAVAGAQSSRLRALAEDSGGEYLDLLSLTTADALRELQFRRPRLVKLGADGADQLVSASSYAVQDRLIIAGRITGTNPLLRLTLETPQGRPIEKQVSLKSLGASALDEVAARQWASLRIAQLDAEPRLHRAEILRLGERFRLVSSQTSLLILESLEDHLRYRVMPSPGLWRTEYESRLQKELVSESTRRTRHLDELARRFEEKVKWWEKDFPKGTPPKPEAADKRALAESAEARSNSERSIPRPLAMMAAPPAPAPVASPAKSGGAPQAQTATTIRLQKWQPDAPYARRLREATDGERYAIYLDEKTGHADSTAFFLDAAEVFFEKGQRELALRVLSNLAEMPLENRAILRILAYRLILAKEAGLAIPLLQRVKELAPDEPQSWRDLGLAMAADKQEQSAVESLWEAAARTPDGRYADIDLIAVGELNAIAARKPGLDLSRVDGRLLRNLPLELRAVLSWDTDNSDMDLWVIDPNGEKAYYAHPLSYQGGRMSRDATGGYGPEEFTLKTAKPGRYEIRAQFYGHRQQVLSPYTTLMLKLSTGFGTTDQKDEDIILRLNDRKDEVLVGTFEVGAKAK